MFENPGRKIKVIAKILFWLMTIASIVLAFVFGKGSYYSSYSGYHTYINWAILLPVLFGGPLFAYLSSLFMSAFGELVENSSNIASRTDFPQQTPEIKEEKAEEKEEEK